MVVGSQSACQKLRGRKGYIPHTQERYATHLVLPPQSNPRLLIHNHNHISNAMPGLVSDATRVWELNVHWALGSQCGVWDPKFRGVDIWECIRARKLLSFIRSHHGTVYLTVFSLPDTAAPSTEPPNPRFWRYVARR